MKPRVAPRPILPATLAAFALVASLADDARAEKCPGPPRDWSEKSLDAYKEGGGIWKLALPTITVPELATALSTAYTAWYHDTAKVQEPVFLARYHDFANAPASSFDKLGEGGYRTDEVVDKIEIRGKPFAHWTWGPNPAHSYYDTLKFATEANRHAAKCKSDGLVLIGYYKAPPEGIHDGRRDPNYIISIMDLTPAHLNWLKGLRTQALAWAKDAYDVDPVEDGDTVKMYFHWPTGMATSTLHMHVRVNWRMSPVEMIHSYKLDDIIAALESGKSVATMIAERYVRMGGVVLDGSFAAMSNPDLADAGPAASGNFLPRFLRTVTHDGERVFSDVRALPNGNAGQNANPVGPFLGVKDVMRTAQIVELEGQKIYVQKAPISGAEKAAEKGDNTMRVFATLDPTAWWHAGDQLLFTPGEITDLKLTNYVGSVRDLMSCLLPLFDGVGFYDDCIRVNDAGTDLERWSAHNFTGTLTRVEEDPHDSKALKLTITVSAGAMKTFKTGKGFKCNIAGVTKKNVCALYGADEQSTSGTTLFLAAFKVDVPGLSASNQVVTLSRR